MRPKVLRISVYFQKVLKNLLNKKCRKIPYLSDFAASTLYIEYDIIFQLSDVLSVNKESQYEARVFINSHSFRFAQRA